MVQILLAFQRCVWPPLFLLGRPAKFLKLGTGPLIFHYPGPDTLPLRSSDVLSPHIVLGEEAYLLFSEGELRVFRPLGKSDDFCYFFA